MIIFVLEVRVMQFFLAFLVGCLVASLGEYWVHRLMHQRMIKVQVHADHHRDNIGQGFLMEYLAYLPSLLVSVPIAIACYYLIGKPAAMGWFFGTLISTAFSAWSHQVQHTDPNLVFWSKPLHYFHHNYTPNHNFGFNCSWWDKLFRTHKPVPWKRAPIPWAKYLQVALW